MRAVGIIAEYNPFHNGHLHHMLEARRLSKQDNIVAVMSGSFVQRGEPAAWNKLTRAHFALLSGVDMIIELPTIYALSSAQQFASGAVKLLNQTSIVGHIAFGSEVSDISAIRAIAEHDIDGDDNLKAALKSGKSYPRAVYEAFKAAKLDASVISSPNSTLAVEYIRAMNRFAPEITPIAIERIGAGHDSSSISQSMASASHIREMFRHCNYDEIQNYLPYPASMLSTKYLPAEEVLFLLLRYKLLSTPLDELADYGEVSEGIESVLAREARLAACYADFLHRIKKKRFSMARLRRICMCILLGIDKALQQKAYDCNEIPYIRVLGVRREALPMLAHIKQSGTPLITCRADTKNVVSPLGKMMLALDEYAYMTHDLICGHQLNKDEFGEQFIVV